MHGALLGSIPSRVYSVLWWQIRVRIAGSSPAASQLNNAVKCQVVIGALTEAPDAGNAKATILCDLSRASRR